MDSSPDNPMVERVAGAIHIARFNSPRGAYEPWEMDESDREYTTRLARAAIAALTASLGDPQELIERLEAPAYWMSGSSEGHEGDNSAPREAAVALRAYSIEIEGRTAERDSAQSLVEAWAQTVECLEAHIQDRAAMGDPASPETYLSILRGNITRVQKDSEQIRAARWAAEARLREQIEGLRRRVWELRSMVTRAGIRLDAGLADKNSLVAREAMRDARSLLHAALKDVPDGCSGTATGIGR